MALTFYSAFSGIEGIGLGFERAGMTCVGQCESDPKARDILARHFPGVPVHDDIATLHGADIAPVDLVCGGFPCQDVSVAGRRAGLAGDRSGLWHEFHRVVGEARPRWVVIENVPGLLSSNGGRDMGTVLAGLGELGYGWAYRILDAQYFGVAQRRRRVFVVGHLGAPWAAPAQVLFEPESVCGDPPPSRATGARTAVGSRVGADDGGIVGSLRSHPWPGSDTNGALTLAPTLQGGGKRGYRVDAEMAGGGGAGRQSSRRP